MSEWKSGYVEANGTRLHYTRTGGDLPALVLAHGFSDDGLCWTPVAQALEADFDIVLLDARYHGRSAAPAQPCQASVMADDLAGAIQALALRRPIILGHSMGALSALIVAGRYPALPRAVALEDPPPDWARVRGPAASGDWLAHNRAWIAGLQQQTRAAIVAAKHLESPTWPLDELGPWADSKLSFNPAYFEHVQPPQLDGQELLARITCEVLLITADPGLGAIVSDEQAAAFGAAVPQARRAHIPGAGHNVRREQFAAYMAAVGGQLQAWQASE